jgi:hypothetical protein
MGMLINRHRDRNKDQPAPRKRKRKSKAEKPAPPVSPYTELTDEQVADAYATNVGGEATERDAQVAELEALDNE